MLVPINDIFLFHNMRDKDKVKEIDAIWNTVLIVANDHVDKMVMNPSYGTWTKNRDMLSVWTNDSVRRTESVEKHAAAETLKNWDDDKTIFHLLSKLR